MLDAGCGNGRSFETLSDDPIKVGMDASLSLLICTKKRWHADLRVCDEFGHLSFKKSVYGTFLNFRLRQQIVE